MTKIKFAVQDFSIEENPSSHFAVLDMKIVSSGMNLHNLPIEKDAIINSSPSLFGKPVLAHYIEEEEALGGHDKEEIPIGVFLDNEVRIEDEGEESWLFAKAYVWKKYFPHIVDVFRKDGGKTDISMEIEVVESEIKEDGFEWIKAFDFLGVTAIGVTPAIQGSGATVLQFSEMVDEIKKEFDSRYNDLSFVIPDAVKKNAQQALNLRKKFSRGGTSVAMATARYLIKNEEVTPEKIRYMEKYFSRHLKDNIKDKQSNEWIAWQLLGGNPAKKWAFSLVKQMDELDKDEPSELVRNQDALSSLNYSKKENQSGVLSSSGKNNEGIGLEKEENLKKKKNEEVEVVFAEGDTIEVDEKEDVAMSEEAPKEKEEAPADEKFQDEESPSEDAKEESEEEGEKPEADMSENSDSEDKPTQPDSEEMSMDAYADVEWMMGVLVAETEDARNGFAEIQKKEGVDFSVVANGLYAMCKDFAEQIKAAKVQSEEIQELKSFKEEANKKEFSLKIQETLDSVREFVSQEQVDAWQEDAKQNFSIENIDAWAKEVKASVFSLIKDMNKDGDDFQRIQFPFNDSNKSKSKKYIW